ncbi:MAG TPA: choice-of-anchor D domain-containing protein [Bradyrhizobium sp.]|nr:choice-of-anchor D domain-containing protein [Bradyrhizobium sp.]
MLNKSLVGLFFILVSAFAGHIYPGVIEPAFSAEQQQSSSAQGSSAVSLDRNAIEFGDQVVGETSNSRRVTVTNPGGRPLYVNSIETRGENQRDFAIVEDSCTGNTIAPNRSCIVDVRFTPSATGDRRASLMLTDNAQDNPQKLGLTGSGINSIDVPPFGVL